MRRWIRSRHEIGKHWSTGGLRCPVGAGGGSAAPARAHAERRPRSSASRTRTQRLLREVLTVGLAVGLTFPLAPAVAAQGVPTSATAEARRSVASLTALLDPVEYDVGALALELAFEEPAVIAAWVDQNIAYEVYPGLLRGPQGTLVAGAGNALDQSVLLARLLGDAGYDARVALGTLSSLEARRLLLSMFDTNATSEADVETDLSQIAAAIAAAVGADAPATEAALTQLAEASISDTPAYAEAVDMARELLEDIPDTSVSDATDELVEEAQQYAWVEFRLGTSDVWTSAHPAWPGASEPPEVEAERHLVGEVPAELQHRLRLEMTVERKRGDSFVTDALMTPWERPIANLLGHTLTIGNTVLGGSGVSTFAELGTEVADAAFYAPVLDGALAPGAMAFDLQGNLVPPDAAMSAMAGLFQTMGQKMGGALGALGGLGGPSEDEDEEPFALTAQWLDVVLIAPGGEETRHRRTVFDRRAPGSREAGGGELLDQSVLLDGIITTYSLMAAGGRVSSAYVAHVFAEQAAFHLDVIDALAARTGTSDEDERSAALVSAVIALVGALTPTGAVTSSSGADIITSAKRTLSLEDESVYRDVEAGVLAGVWDTVVERQFVASYGRPVANATNGVHAAQRQMLTEPDLTALEAAGVPPTAVGAVVRDMENGYAVLVPRRDDPARGPDASSSDWYYWRVDLVTGETLGMTSAGRGGAYTEFLVGLKVGLIVNSALAVPSLAQCVASGASWLCYCDVIASGALLSLVGGLVGALIKAQSALAVYAIVDITVVGPVTTVHTPPVCSAFATGPVRRLAERQADETLCWAV